MEGKLQVNGVDLWYRVSGEGEPVAQIHGAGFGHFNFDLATPALAQQFRVVDYDLRGYGQSDRPRQRYDMEVWADDLAGLLDGLEIERAHVHGTSMGGMIAIVFAGKYPERTGSVVINCAAAKLGRTGRLIFRNWIGIARLDPDGPGSRRRSTTRNASCASRTTSRCSRRSARRCADGRHRLATEDRRPGARARRGRRPDDPLGSGAEGAGQETIYEGIAGAQKPVIRGSGQSTIFDNSEEHNRVVVEFFRGHSLTAA